MGLTGAAIGTVMARGIGVLIALVILYSGKNVIRILPGTYRPDWQMFRDIFSISVPSGIQGVYRNGSRLLVISIVTSTEVATFGAAAIAISFLRITSLVLSLSALAMFANGNLRGAGDTIPGMMSTLMSG
ncbi:MAG: hypothetical protein Q9P01_09480 [Anaerolineae bacterium]|nr:hypothetical protein [Anaerolineae bacterium]MDQ7035048.1 hypothetical protein [Anaerolineae bacterium]